jgi:hypothetical protein
VREVVEHDPGARHHHQRVGEFHVGGRLRPDALEHARRIVGEDAHRTTRERQAAGVDVVFADQRADVREHVRIVVEHRRFEIVDPDERVARDAVGAFDRFQQTRTPRLSQGEKRANRRNCVRDERARHGLQRKRVVGNRGTAHTR